MPSYPELANRVGDRVIARYDRLEVVSAKAGNKLPGRLTRPLQVVRPLTKRYVSAVKANYDVTGRVLSAQRHLFLSLAGGSAVPAVVSAPTELRKPARKG